MTGRSALVVNSLAGEAPPTKTREESMKSTLLFALALFAAPSFAATPAEMAIKQAVGNIEKQPSHYPHYNALAMAYARRARETSDAQFYAKAEETVQKSFAIAPDNFDGLKVETFLQLERHEYARALEAPLSSIRKFPTMCLSMAT